jgi:hypothetical protein
MKIIFVPREIHPIFRPVYGNFIAAFSYFTEPRPISIWLDNLANSY